MDQAMLRKVQLQQLEIAKEIARVCQKHNIKYFLDSGSLIGAVRHKGFIPWDDDLDIGMLRADYKKWCEVAPSELGEHFYWQTWDNEEKYANPFGKVRKVGTVFIEQKAARLKENGFFVDILPYDYAPENADEREKFRKRLVYLYYCILLKCGYTPWMFAGKSRLKSRIKYLVYQALTITKSRDDLIREYESLTASIGPTKYVFEQSGRWLNYYDIHWFDETIMLDFEDVKMPAISKYHEWLTKAYGDYMTPPPEGKRENQHEIFEVDFGE